MSDDELPPPPRARRRLSLFAVVAVLALVADVVSKSLVVAQLADRAPLRVLGGLFYLQLIRNSGAAFSLGTGFTAVLTVVALAVVVVILRVARNLRSVGWAVGLALVLGGALGNLVDRLFRAPGVGRGHVVDWISAFAPDAQKWPIFNIADSCVVCGVIVIGIVSLRGVAVDGSRSSSDTPNRRR